MQLGLQFVGPVTDHDASDRCGADILGVTGSSFVVDQAGAGINAIRTRTLLRACDIVVARFSRRHEFYEWNSAFDAGLAFALGKPVITLHPEELDHPLKEVDRGALAVARDISQVAELLDYAFRDVAAGVRIAALTRSGVPST